MVKFWKCLPHNCSERNYRYLEVGMIDTSVLQCRDSSGCKMEWNLPKHYSSVYESHVCCAQLQKNVKCDKPDLIVSSNLFGHLFEKLTSCHSEKTITISLIC